MSDIHDRIERDENALQKLMQDIPGFDGYREREIRRTADKLLRERLVERLDQIRAGLKDMVRERAKAGELEGIDDLDRLSRMLGKVRDNVRFADYGYTGFFDAVKIRPEDLDRLYDHDLSLRSQIDECNKAIVALRQSDQVPVEEKMAKVERAIEGLQELVDQREEVLTSVTPDDSE